MIQCPCGCGRSFPPKTPHGGRPRMYFDDSCRKKCARQVAALIRLESIMRRTYGPQLRVLAPSVVASMLAEVRRLQASRKWVTSKDSFRIRTRLADLEKFLTALS
jgi:hypothetical protein